MRRGIVHSPSHSLPMSVDVIFGNPLGSIWRGRGKQSDLVILGGREGKLHGMKGEREGSGD